MTTYILERQGWGQWRDEGGRWVGNREAARQYDDEDEATADAAALNDEFAAEAGDDSRDDVIVTPK